MLKHKLRDSFYTTKSHSCLSDFVCHMTEAQIFMKSYRLSFFFHPIINICDKSLNWKFLTWENTYTLCRKIFCKKKRAVEITLFYGKFIVGVWDLKGKQFSLKKKITISYLIYRLWIVPYGVFIVYVLIFFSTLSARFVGI